MNTNIVKTLVAVTITALAASLFYHTPVGAYSPGANSYLSNDVVFQAYVKAGETVDANFVRAIVNVPSAAKPDTLMIRQPGGVTVTCTISAESSIGTRCNVPAGMTSAVDGIWTLEFDRDSDGIQLTNSTGINAYTTWNITVSDNGTPVTGRLWSDFYNLNQGYSTLTSGVGVDLTMWYVGETGQQYRATFLGYNGIDSSFYADPYGVRTTADCIPAYKSVNQTAAVSAIIDDASCGGRYHIFFESPASDLPEYSVLSDGSTMWVVPPLQLAAFGEAAFAHADDSAVPYEGTFSVPTTNFQGTLTLYVDTDGNGSYTDPVDRRILLPTADDLATYEFDGRDANGAIIPRTVEVTARAAITQVGEVHFVNRDVELRGGGLQIQRLNGGASGRSTLYWNDTELATAGRCTTTPQLDGRSGVDTSVGGRHAWGNLGCSGSGNSNNGTNGSWGDWRYIDDWTYDTYNATTSLVLTPAAATVPPAQDPRDNPSQPSSPSSDVRHEALAATGMPWDAIVAGSLFAMLCACGLFIHSWLRSI